MKINKQAAFLEQLHTMVTTKVANSAPIGKPNTDVKSESVDAKTETVSKNEEGHPEKLEQEFHQEPNKTHSDPTKHKKAGDEVTEVTPEAKTAEDLEKDAKHENAAEQMAGTALKAKPPGKGAKVEEAPNEIESKEAEAKDNTPATNEKLAALGEQLLTAINQIKEANSKPVGKPNADVKSESTNVNEHVNKENQGKPEDNPQEFKQEKAKDDPTKKGHKKAEDQGELDKLASYELGRQFARTFLTTKVASQSDMEKSAGRRDFETLIAQAAAELENEQPQKQAQTQPVVNQAEANDEAEQIKLAEEAGAQAFYTMAKQAQEQEQANQIKLAFETRVNQLLQEKQSAEAQAQQYALKLAEYDKAMEKKAEDEKLDTKLAQWGQYVTDSVINRLKTEQVSK